MLHATVIVYIILDLIIIILDYNFIIGSFYEDVMSRSDSQHSNVSEVIRRKLLISRSSSNEHLKKDNEMSKIANKKSQFYTPVRSRRGGDRSSLPPLPPSLSGGTGTRNVVPTTSPYSEFIPLRASITMDDCPPLPPSPQLKPPPLPLPLLAKTNTALHDLERDERPDDTPKSLKKIQAILESSSAPDLLEVQNDDKNSD